MQNDLNPIDVQIGKNLKALRLDRGLTRAQLGAALSEPLIQQSIERYETGKNRIAASTLVELAGILKCRVEHLIEGAADHLKAYEAIGMADRKTINLMQQYQALGNEAIQEAVRNMVSAISLELTNIFTGSKPQ